MSDEEPECAFLDRVPRVWKVASVIVGLGLLLIVGLFLTPGPRPVTAPRNRAVTSRPDSTPASMVELLRKDNDLQACRSVLQQLNARQVAATAPSLQPAEVAFLRQVLRLDDGDLQEIANPTFTPLDAHYLATCCLLHEAARSLQVSGQPAREQATSAFAWVVRQVRLEETNEELYPAHAVLRRGWGTDLQRALVFLALLEQLDIPGCMLGVANRPWLPGALVDGQLLVFDTRLGVPLPGAHFAQLRQLAELPPDLAALQYDVTADQLKEAQIYRTCALSALAPRMKLLEKQLGSGLPVRLSTTAMALEQPFRAAGLPVQFWPLPTRALRAYLPPEDGGDDRSRTRQARFNGQLIAWHALPAEVEKIPPEVDLGLRLRNVFAAPFLDFVLKPKTPRDLVLRGRHEEAVGLLVETLEAVQRQAGTDQEKPFARWCQDARKAQEDVLLARRRASTEKTPETQAHLQAAEGRLSDAWKQGQPTLGYLSARAAGPLGAQASYLLALAKHEQAELAQAQRDPATARTAWEAARDRWRKYLADQPASAGATAARLNLARCLEVLGDRDGALAVLGRMPELLQTWNERAVAYRVRQLKP